MEGKNPYSLRTLPDRLKRKADENAAKSKEETKDNAKRASNSKANTTKPKTELSDEDQSKIINKQIPFIDKRYLLIYSQLKCFLTFPSFQPERVLVRFPFFQSFHLV